MQKLTRILHVEDDEDIREVAKISLEVFGEYELQQCASGPEALESAQEFQPQLFLLDVMMPEMSGQETLAALLKLPGLADVPAIFMTAKAQVEEMESFLEWGAVGVIPKPFDPVKLSEEVGIIWNSIARL